MKPNVDPEGVEVSHLISAIQPGGKDILEIGCGHGNLTVQYAGLSRKVIGIDPIKTELKLASGNIAAPGMNISFIQAMGERLPFPAQAFDIVIFASSL